MIFLGGLRNGRSIGVNPLKVQLSKRKRILQKKGPPEAGKRANKRAGKSIRDLVAKFMNNSGEKINIWVKKLPTCVY